MTAQSHQYTTRLVWTGNTGQGTAGYTGYGRDYTVAVDGKPDLYGSSDPAFRGDPSRHNPEDLFVASLSACHMLFFLSLAARQGIRVLAYEDDAQGTMVTDGDGGGKFDEVVLRPRVTIAEGSDAELVAQLHVMAHERCFIANSCNFTIRHEATMRVAPDGNAS